MAVAALTEVKVAVTCVTIKVEIQVNNLSDISYELYLYFLILLSSDLTALATADL